MALDSSPVLGIEDGGINKWLVLPQKSEFVRKDNVGWPALLKKRSGDIPQEKAPMNHLGTSVMTTQTR